MKKIITLALIFIPSPALAYSDITDLLSALKDRIYQLIPTVFLLAVIFFFYGLVKFVYSVGDGDERERAKKIMVWGIIALFVLSLIWGIIAFLNNDVFQLNSIRSIYQ